METPPTAGCGLELDALLAVLRARHRDDLAGRVLDLTTDEAREAKGRPIQNNSCDTRDSEGWQQDSSYVLGRLKRDRPDLAAQVANGTISANKAAIEAGIRHRYVRVRIDDISRAISVLLAPIVRATV